MSDSNIISFSPRSVFTFDVPNLGFVRTTVVGLEMTQGLAPHGCVAICHLGSGRQKQHLHILEAGEQRET